MYYAGHVSPDGRWLTVVEFKGNMDQDIHLLDLDTREVRNLTAHEGESVFLPSGWSRDSGSFYLLTNHGREFTALGVYGLEQDRWQVIHAPEHDVEDFALARSGETTLASINAAGASRLQAYDMTTGAEIALPDLPHGVVHEFALHPSERRAVLALGRPTEATNLYHFGFDGDVQPLEQSMLGGIDPESLPEPDSIAYASFDRDVPAWLYRPEGDGPYPFVLSIHGGPESIERPEYRYDGLYQYLLSRGIGVLAPNIRGSTGFGRTYQKLIHRDWGGDELEDIRHAAEWLRAQPWADADRLAVYGGSFGGFATLSALARLPEYWAVGVDVVGPSNLVTFAGSVPPHWRAFMRDLVGDPEDDRDMLLERSPITYVDRIRAPLLIIQGANDPRVVQAESDQMVERLRERGLEVEYYVDPEGGHGASDRAGRLRWYRMIATYLEDRLAPAEA
jgi:dipeptidyl aminopeptidase/acylaminoacyl peptidase